MKLRCLQHYGGDPPYCACCGESEIGFLTLDFVNKDAASYRSKKTNASFYRYLIRDGFPSEPELQVLCYNCNFGRTINRGICPHKEPMSIETHGRLPFRKPSDTYGRREPAVGGRQAEKSAT